MSSGPGSPRRRRSSGDEDDRGGLPMVPLFAGVIIAGLGIGALLSALAARHVPTPRTSSSPLVVMHTPTPIASVAVAAATPTLASTSTATPRPKATHTASPQPTPTATPEHTVKPAQTPAATPTPAQTRTPAAIVTRAPAPAPASTRVAQALAATPVAAVANPAESLVRRFLEAIAHGDDPGAHSTLGGGSGSLEEMQYLDPSMRILSISSTRATSGGTDVQVEMRTVRGQYFGTFSVDPTGTRITQHEVIPVGGTTTR